MIEKVHNKSIQNVSGDICNMDSSSYLNIKLEPEQVAATEDPMPTESNISMKREMTASPLLDDELNDNDDFFGDADFTGTTDWNQDSDGNETDHEPKLEVYAEAIVEMDEKPLPKIRKKRKRRPEAKGEFKYEFHTFVN